MEAPLIKTVFSISTLWHGMASAYLLLRPKLWLLRYSNATAATQVESQDLCRGIGGLNCAFTVLSGWALVRFMQTKKVLASDACVLAVVRLSLLSQ
jgi:hypothetical protein